MEKRAKEGPDKGDSAEVIDFPADQAMPALSRQQTSFEESPINGPVQDILESLRVLSRLNGAILYVVDNHEAVLHLKSFSSNKPISDSESEEIRRVKLPCDAKVEKSFAASIFSSRIPDYSDDSWADKKFSTRTLKLVGVTGAAYGVPVALDHQIFGVLIAWADVNQMSEFTRKEVRVAASGITTILAKFNRDVMKFKSIGGLTTVSQKISRDFSMDHIFNEMAGVLKYAMFERSRFFVRRNESDYFDLAFENDTTGKTSYPTFSTVSETYAGTGASPHFQYIFNHFLMAGVYSKPKDELLAKQHAFLFSSLDLGVDPFGAKFDRPTDLQWIFAPILSVDGLIGYISVDNRISRRFIRSENVAYLQAVGWLMKLFLSSQTGQIEEELDAFRRYIQPIYTSVMDGKTDGSRGPGLYSRKQNGPRIYISPDFNSHILKFDSKDLAFYNSSSINVEEETISKYETICENFRGTFLRALPNSEHTVHQFMMTTGGGGAIRAIFCANSIASPRAFGPATGVADASLVQFSFKSETDFESFVKRLEKMKPLIEHFMELPEIEGRISGAFDLEEVEDLVPASLIDVWEPKW